MLQEDGSVVLLLITSKYLHGHILPDFLPDTLTFTRTQSVTVQDTGVPSHHNDSNYPLKINRL